jgi:nucleotide-binding universal stress UspA family protein
MRKSVLVPLDGSPPAEPALVLAAVLPIPTAAYLLLVRVSSGKVPSGGGPRLARTSRRRPPIFGVGDQPRLLVPMDGSRFSEAVLAAALALGDDLGGEILLVRVDTRRVDSAPIRTFLTPLGNTSTTRWLSRPQTSHCVTPHLAVATSLTELHRMDGTRTPPASEAYPMGSAGNHPAGRGLRLGRVGD